MERGRPCGWVIRALRPRKGNAGSPNTVTGLVKDAGQERRGSLGTQPGAGVERPTAHGDSAGVSPALSLCHSSTPRHAAHLSLTWLFLDMSLLQFSPFWRWCPRQALQKPRLSLHPSHCGFKAVWLLGAGSQGPASPRCLPSPPRSAQPPAPSSASSAAAPLPLPPLPIRW